MRVGRHADDGLLRVDRSATGRGAWLCRGAVPGLPVTTCLDQAVRSRAFSRAFRVPVEAAAVALLRENVEERARMDSGDAVMATGHGRD